MPSVGTSEFFGAIIYDTAGAVVSTGTASIQFIVEDSGTTKFLQDDLTTISATPNSIDATFDSDYGAHGITLTIPEALRGFTVTWIITDFSSPETYSDAFVVPSSGSGSSSGLRIVGT